MTRKRTPRHRLKNWGVAAVLSLAVGSSLVTLAADPVPSDAVTDAKSSGIRQSITRSFNQLSDDLPTIRENARRRLMLLSRKDLSVLRDIVKSRLPLNPAEADALHEIVTQSYLSDDSYPTEATHGFLGVLFGFDQESVEPECGGVEIRCRVPGFCAYRCFEDGDIVLAIGDAQDELELHNSSQMTVAVQSHAAGQRVLFKVLRRGRLVRVPVVLDARPLGVNAASMVVDFSARRNAEAEAYWDENFESLVDEHR